MKTLKITKSSAFPKYLSTVEYLKRQSYADRFYSDSRRAEFRNNYSERNLFLEFIDEAEIAGAKKYQEIIKEKVKKANSWQEFNQLLK